MSVPFQVGLVALRVDTFVSSKANIPNAKAKAWTMLSITLPSTYLRQPTSLNFISITHNVNYASFIDIAPCLKFFKFNGCRSDKV